MHELPVDAVDADLHQTGKARKIHIDKWLTLTCRQGGLVPSGNRFCFLSFWPSAIHSERVSFDVLALVSKNSLSRALSSFN